MKPRAAGRDGQRRGGVLRNQPQYSAPADPVRDFLGYVAAELGSAPDQDRLTPGRIVRWDDPNGKRGNAACWAVLFLDGRPAGRFGNWRTGQAATWCADSDRDPITPEERRAWQEQLQRAAEERDRQRTARQEAAAKLASRLWRQAERVSLEGHPYARRKAIPAIGVRVRQGELLVPMRDTAGQLWNLQRIAANGGKRFMRGGRVRDLFCLLAAELPETGELYICEGWATGAALYRALRLPVAAAMNSGNLLPVAESIRTTRPRLDLVLAADDDHRTEGNPGIAAATEAARAVGGRITSPRLCSEPDCQCTDFADVAICGRAPV